MNRDCWIELWFVRATILGGVIFCLCFSVGEGLRLRPFAVSAMSVAGATNAQADDIGPNETNVRHYGPLDQMRGKRQVADYRGPRSENGLELSAHQVFLFNAYEPVVIALLPFRSGLTGRAPPLSF